MIGVVWVILVVRVVCMVCVVLIICVVVLVSPGDLEGLGDLSGLGGPGSHGCNNVLCYKLVREITKPLPMGWSRRGFVMECTVSLLSLLP